MIVTNEKMNADLWIQIQNFDFDQPMSEYSFTVRLANENYWTKEFTQMTILEYKKFMFLAATSDMMVSPSEIVDIVWHQHLIFTQSYEKFCQILGKQIQHIPSTHDKADYHKFKQAKERTRVLYSNRFGEQPKAIWECTTMYSSLELRKALINIRSSVVIGLLLLGLITIPAYLLLKPIYITINNPNFLLAYISLAIITTISLEIWNRRYLQNTFTKISKRSFLYHLDPLELIYLKTQKLSEVANAVVNQMVEQSKIIVNKDFTLEIAGSQKPETTEEFQIFQGLENLGKTHYSNLSKYLISTPIFGNTAKCMEAFTKYVNKSTNFGTLFYLNFGIFGIVFILGSVRLISGILRDKPTTQLVIVLIIFFILILIYLNRLTRLMCTHTIPNIYKTKILPERQATGDRQWQYFLLGSAALTASFSVIIDYIRRNSNKAGGCGTSCGSSCGSSCSSCGGCGD